MRKPKRVDRKKGRKSFARNAKAHVKNYQGAPMRGGIRL